MRTRPGMEMPVRIIILITVSSFIVMIPLFSARAGFIGSEAGAPRAENGVLDLRSVQFGEIKGLSLSGEWEFLPGRLVTGTEAASTAFPTLRSVPDQWKGSDAGGVDGRGCGTYRLKILMPEYDDDLALRWTTAATAFSIFVDGHRMGGAGVPAETPEKATAAYHSEVLKLPALGREVSLILQVSNWEYRVGGLWRPILIGDFRALSHSKEVAELLTYLSVGLLASIALQGIAIFFFRHKEALGFFFLGLFASIIALRALVTGEYTLTSLLPWISFDTLIRIEYLTVFTATPLGILFFGAEFAKKPRYFLALPHLLFLIILPFAPLPLLTRTFVFYYPVVAITVALCFFLDFGKALLRGETGTQLMLYGIVIILGASINDVFFASFVIRTGNMVPSALAGFTLIANLVLAWRYVQAFYLSEALLAEKENYLREMHHRVKNSLQIVSSMMTLQSNRLKDPETAGLFRSMRQRIRSIALVHEKLYTSTGDKTVDLEGYVRDLVKNLRNSHEEDSTLSDSSLSVESPLGQVPIEICVDFGLVLTELILNGYKHAGSAVNLSLSRVGVDIIARISDHGPGFPVAFSPAESNSLGYKIISAVVGRNGGTLTTSNSEGGGAVISIKMPTTKR